MDERVGGLQQCGRVGKREIEPPLLGLRLPGNDVGDVDGDDARDTRVLFETGEHAPSDGAGRAGDDHRAPFGERLPPSCEGLGAREGVGHHPPTMPM